MDVRLIGIFFDVPFQISVISFFISFSFVGWCWKTKFNSVSHGCKAKTKAAIVDSGLGCKVKINEILITSTLNNLIFNILKLILFSGSGFWLDWILIIKIVLICIPDAMCNGGYRLFKEHMWFWTLKLCIEIYVCLQNWLWNWSELVYGPELLKEIIL